MAQSAIKQLLESSPYYGACFLLTTKHSKSIALNPSFERILGAGILEYVVDTDTLGTFSGEIERKGTALECAREKCERGLKETNADYALASEGSFGSHTFIPFLPSNSEILYFIDRVRNFHLHVTDVTSNTNYQIKEIGALEELHAFSENAFFPSHALIIRSYPKEIEGPIFKGIENKADLEAAFLETIKFSPKNKVWVETDMRADFNPTRMKFIGKLGEKLAQRLNCECPHCGTPGWGKTDVESGLPCELCGLPTEQIKSEIHACNLCKYKENLLINDQINKAEAKFCNICNP